jgi:hypothetical protein
MTARTAQKMERSTANSMMKRNSTKIREEACNVQTGGSSIATKE